MMQNHCDISFVVAVSFVAFGFSKYIYPRLVDGGREFKWLKFV